MDLYGLSGGLGAATANLKYKVARLSVVLCVRPAVSPFDDCVCAERPRDPGTKFDMPHLLCYKGMRFYNFEACPDV